MMTCDLCAAAGGDVIWQDAQLRVIHVPDADYPAYFRVIWQQHVREITDLPHQKQQLFLGVLLALETAIREVAAPDKINLAVFGNITPHLHGHVMGRWQGDRHFPNPVWGAVVNPAAQPPAIDQAGLRERVRQRVVEEVARHAAGGIA